MLEYENQMLLDLLHEDGLIVTAKGLGIERILIGLLASYADKGNLVLVIGLSTKEIEYILAQMEDMELSPLPKCVNADSSIADRSQIYLDGGCLFVTSRILVVDLLMSRIPADLITGIVVWKAHTILESGQEAFILRLYRQKNKTGFIKGFSSNPVSFTLGFCHVERIMKNIFVKKLYLWPRFHLDISNCLNKCQPQVIELHLQLTQPMKQIQMALLDLITVTLQELKVSNRSTNIEEFNAENAISKSFEKMLQIQLDPIWHQLSVRTKQLVADIKILRTMLLHLTQYDCVSFYNLVSSLRTTEKAMQSAGWMLLPAADTLLINSKIRAFGTDKDALKGGPSPEVNPKWIALSEILDEIHKDAEKSKKLQKCLIVTQDDRTQHLLKEYLEYGSHATLNRIFYATLGAKLGIKPPSNLKNQLDSQKRESKDIGGRVKRLKPNEKGEDTQITLTQIAKKYDPPNEEEECFDKFNNLLISIQSLRKMNDPFSVNKKLSDFNPKYIIMYDLDLTFIRQVEVWQALNCELQSCVYFMIYKGTTEEQAYLTDIKREKNAFEYLIKEKSTMVLPEYTEGKSYDHPDLIRKTEKEDPIAEKSTRKGGGVEQEKIVHKVIVDMREFRSELPAILHKMGIDIEPATIDVGDYILTPEICVERKSISDLIGSLNSGRMYTQAQNMTRHYRKPILLIEFDHNKPFYLQGKLILSTDNKTSSKDIMSKLQLLTLHFPNLRLLWCPSPYATGELFHMLKTGKDQPTVEGAQAVSSEDSIDPDRFTPIMKDFVSKLPGVTSKNMFSLLRKVENLSHLMTLSEKELEEILGHSKNARSLYSALHTTMKEPLTEKVEFGKIKRKFGKAPLKKFR